MDYKHDYEQKYIVNLLIWHLFQLILEKTRLNKHIILKVHNSCRGESAKVGQVIILRGNKFSQPVSCVVLNSVCNINFHWVFLFTL